MSTCCWCTPGGTEAVQLLRRYASASSEFAAANDDLCYCLECVDEYHKAREALPALHEALWELETGRLVAHFEASLKDEEGDDDDLFLVEEDRETPLCGYSGAGFEKHLRVPLLEILKYPYLLLHERVSELCVEALCKMEQIHFSYQVVGKHPGIYLLMVHPNEVVRRWAILTARSLGKVDRDDYYDIQEVLTCLFKVIELGLFEEPGLFHSAVLEKGRLLLLPPHLYDTDNYKNYWLGICMLLTVLEEQAMDSLLLGPDKQNDFMQSIMNVMEKETDGDGNNDPFWPVLHCFMVILDKLGSKVWGQLIDPIQAFQTIINNASYKKEIESIRQSCRTRTKSEPPSDYGDELVTCSQIVYNFHPERPSKEVGRRTATCPDYCPNLYEDMQTLTDMFQYDVGRDMRLHNSTFLWFVPFAHSLTDLKDLGMAYSVQVIHHLCSEVRGVLGGEAATCDKVSEFFIWILVSVVELNLKRSCLHFLWVSSENWVEAVVKCARLPRAAFSSHGIDRVPSWEPASVQLACMSLIRNILKEGFQVGQGNARFLDELNLLRRNREEWKLGPAQAKELQECLKHIVRSLWRRSSMRPTLAQELLPSPKGREDTLPPVNIKQEPSEGLAQGGSSPERTGGQRNTNQGAVDSGPKGSRQFEEKRPAPPTEKSGSNASEGKSGPASKSKTSDLTLKLKRLVDNKNRRDSGLEREKDGCKSPQMTKDGVIGSGQSGSAAGIKQEPEERPVEFRSGSGTEGSSEESSSEDETAHIPLSQLREELMRKRADPATARLDRDLRRLTLAAKAKANTSSADSSQEDSPCGHGCVERKIRGATRTWPGSSNAKMSPASIIVISDTSSDEEENKANAAESASRKGEHPATSPDPPSPCDNTESQCFEFETEDDIYSAWQDSQACDEAAGPPVKGCCSPEMSDTEKARQLNEWGYDTDYLGDDILEKAAGDTERQEKAREESTANDRERSGHKDPGTSTSSTFRKSVVRTENRRSPGQRGIRSGKPPRLMPAVVPPKKVHTFPSPTLLTEKLGLSKRVRRAAELSQRTQDSITKLRQYGKAAGELPAQRKAKLIRPQFLADRNKKMLTCQDRYLLSHRKQKEREAAARKPCAASTTRNAKVRGAPGEGNPSRKPPRHRSIEANAAPLSSLALKDVRETAPSDACSPVSGSSKTDVAVTPSGEDPASKEASGEDEDLFLTQRDPVPMELCSQTETPPILSLQTEKGHPEPPEHVFTKPLLPAKPSTTKIFSSASSSRTAHLSKALQSAAKPPTVPRSKAAAVLRTSEAPKPKVPRSVLQPQNQNGLLPQYSGRTMPPVAAVAPRPDPRQKNGNGGGSIQYRDHSLLVKEVLKWSYDMFANINQLGPPDHLLRSVVAPVPLRFRDYNEYFDTFFPLMMLNAFEEAAQEWQENQKAKEQKPFCLSLLNFNADMKKADFIVHIPQSDLVRQLHPKEDDLVFLEVSEKPSFGEEEEPEEPGANPVRFVGLVTRFSQPPPAPNPGGRSERAAVCHLSVQTQADLSRADKRLRCLVGSSLVTTQRRFRALLLLNRSPLAKALLSPSPDDFRPRACLSPEPAASSGREFNEEQRQAIEVAFSMVTQHPTLPKVCLVHGPPGTGKSKAIVGLLHCILSQRPGKENPPQSLNAKIKRNRVLICAPSNAAVDDLMKKIILEFKEKCQDKNNPKGNCGDINLVRLGQQKSISKDVRRFSLNDQIDHRISKATLGKDQDLQKRKEDLDRRLDLLSRERAIYRSEKREKMQPLDDEICRLSQERQRLASQLKEVRGRSQELKASVILESHVVCCTLTTSGGGLLESPFRRLGGDPVSCVIVDEAGQTCEVETLIPLIHGCKKLVLVGDPKQLPPTVKSMKAQDFHFDQALMSRLCRLLEGPEEGAGVPAEPLGPRRSPVLRLSTQYRMHPEICLFPAKYIYGGALFTDRQTAENRFSLEWPFQPYLLFDVLDGKEERDSDSYSNPAEVRLVIELMKLIKEKRWDLGFRHVGIITPYNAQKRRIRKQLDAEFGENSASEVDTVDGFQGREKDCVIVTCVRANSTQGSIGFLRSLQRLNVTITRAKFSLFILGKLKTLMENKDWNELIQDAQKRGNIVQTSSGSYKSSALKILKSRPLPPTTTTTKGPKKAAPRAPAEAKPPAQGEPATAERRPPAPGEPSSSCKKPPLPLPLPEASRPKDPRLARRAVSGGVDPHPVPHGAHPSPSNPEAVAKAFLAQLHEWTLARGEPPPPLPPEAPPQAKEIPSNGRRASGERLDGPVDSKRRRTTC
nr:PREDICTED: LOW QUALITY PROTEIN: probable helicase senataxin [Anolis carolinensis]|eukprot:XP_008123104.1 PREDICTED: LOW QUALITY PROTEIN: probable helicase senataxin [Anolis carolinensis]